MVSEQPPAKLSIAIGIRIYITNLKFKPFEKNPVYYHVK